MEKYDLATPGVWVEGEAEAKDLIFALAEEITSIPSFPTLGSGSEPNRWEEVFRQKEDVWVTYKENFREAQGTYRHTDGRDYPVYKIPDLRSSGYVDSDGFIHEVQTETNNQRTGRKIQVVSMEIEDIKTGVVREFDVPGLLVVNIDESTEDNPNNWVCYAVRQIKVNFDETIEDSEHWNTFEIIGKVSSDWSYALRLNNQNMVVGSERRSGAWYTSTLRVATRYSFQEVYYTAQSHFCRDVVVLKATPSVPDGVTPYDYYVMLERPEGHEYNYIDVYYGLGFKGTNNKGDSRLTWEDACDPQSIGPHKTPEIIDQRKASDLYKIQESGEPLFEPGTLTWEKDYDGVTDMVSPPYHFFHGRDSTVPWLPKKKRRPDYKVRYWMSVNNDRVAMVIEGDPAPSITDYYRSFGYIGRIVPFNPHDYFGNFGVTVGMGDVDKAKTGFTYGDIRENTNPVYAGWGEYTSNGMYSMSMLMTRGIVFFQAHYPAFLTQLPNYPQVGTLPKSLQRLVLDKDGFQASSWTEKYHASPIYLVHKAEGYRGYLDGVVAIHDHNIVNLDELVVDTEIPKNPDNPEEGTIIEVYKFFSLVSPVNLFKYSPAPDTVSVAILKETR